MVLSLPIECTATLACAPICAIHSRSAEMVSSRPMMMTATTASRRPSATSITSATHTMSLSATGSRKAPKAEVCPSRRASQPSSQSVSAAATNSTVAETFCASRPIGR